MKTKKEFRVYRIDISEIKSKNPSNILDGSNKVFMNEAERQGNVYSLTAFADAFNSELTNEVNSFIRIIEVPNFN